MNKSETKASAAIVDKRMLPYVGIKKSDGYTEEYNDVVEIVIQLPDRHALIRLFKADGRLVVDVLEKNTRMVIEPVTSMFLGVVEDK